MAILNSRHGTVICEYTGSLKELLMSDHSLFLDDVDLREADLRGISIDSGQFIGADLRGADLREAQLYWAWFSYADLRHADLRNGSFRGAIFDYARMEHADVRGADFGLDNVGGSTSFVGANLSNIRLGEASVEGALYDNATIFPARFDPKGAGMRSLENASGKK